MPFFENDGPHECPDDDHKTYLMARHRLRAMLSTVESALGEMGYQREPETRH